MHNHSRDVSCHTTSYTVTSHGSIQASDLLILSPTPPTPRNLRHLYLYDRFPHHAGSRAPATRFCGGVNRSAGQHPRAAHLTISSLLGRSPPATWQVTPVAFINASPLRGTQGIRLRPLHPTHHETNCKCSADGVAVRCHPPESGVACPREDECYDRGLHWAIQATDSLFPAYGEFRFHSC